MIKVINKAPSALSDDGVFKEMGYYCLL